MVVIARLLSLVGFERFVNLLAFFLGAFSLKV